MKAGPIFFIFYYVEPSVKKPGFKINIGIALFFIADTLVIPFHQFFYAPSKHLTCESSWIFANTVEQTLHHFRYSFVILRSHS